VRYHKIPCASFCTLRISSSLGGMQCSLSGVGGEIGDIARRMASDGPGVKLVSTSLYVFISSIMVAASRASRASAAS